MDGALASLDLNLALSKATVERAQQELWSARLDQRAGEFSSFFDAFQARFYEDGTAYEAIFVAALERAVKTLSDETATTISECAQKGNSPFGMSGPGGTSGAACAGEDFSVKIAAHWDQDSELAAQLAALAAKPWPTLTAFEGAEPALSRSTAAASTQDGWLMPSRLVANIPEATELLDAIEIRTEDARRELIAESRALPDSQEAAEQKLAAIRERAKGVRSYAETAKAELGEALWQSLDRATKRNKTLKKKQIGICMNPEDWGSCTGEDFTPAVGDVLLADRKLQKTLAKLLAGLGTPPTDP